MVPVTSLPAAVADDCNCHAISVWQFLQEQEDDSEEEEGQAEEETGCMDSEEE